MRRLDAIVRDRILSHDGVVRVKIWKRDGTIIYSDEPRLIGDTYTLGADDLASLSNGETEAETTDLSRPENRFERGEGELLEVYLPIHARTVSRCSSRPTSAPASSPRRATGCGRRWRRCSSAR